jgi:hypothetical protein
MSLKTGAYRCLLARGETCTALATVQVVDGDGSHTRGCLTHSIAVLRAVPSARVVWGKTSVNEWGRAALELQESAVPR